MISPAIRVASPCPSLNATSPGPAGEARAIGPQRLCKLAALLAAAAFAVPFAELVAASRRPPHVAFARQAAMYLAHVSFGIGYSEVGRAFGRDRTTAAHACRLVEERRDDPGIDALLASLESACGRLRRVLDSRGRL